ncbi:MAG: hypothetical protein LBM13_06250 [Candidatus Ancillula sp.]|jgi:archaellum component FlaC|nr:hypothetical protein [Candidatus Ancillula sp.]
MGKFLIDTDRVNKLGSEIGKFSEEFSNVGMKRSSTDLKLGGLINPAYSFVVNGNETLNDVNDLFQQISNKINQKISAYVKDVTQFENDSRNNIDTASKGVIGE